MIRYAKLALSIDAEAIKNELSLLKADWQQHFNTFYYEGSWVVLPLRSPGGESSNIIPDLMAKADYLDTDHMRHFTAVKELLSNIKCEAMSVRFLNLQAGAVIKPHRDNELAFEKGEARLHFPIITNPGIEFCIESEQIILQEGTCWYINANLPHSVANNGDTDRIHLVIDCKVNEWLSDMINQAEQTAFKQANSNNDLPKIIAELRQQNTLTSNQLADEMEQQLNETAKDS
jgi:quercetin dioxygenase-like cupin family protein